MVHVPHALLHRLAVASGDDDCGDASTAAAMVRALEAHFKRCELPAEVEVASAGAWRWQIRPPSTAPKVSLIIPTRNGLKLLKRCIEGIFSATRYANFDMIVIDNGSDDPATLHYLAELRGRARIRVHRDDSAFNYSALNNAAVRMTDADYVALVNNDIEVIGGDWLEEMLGLAAMPGVGGVGARLLYPDRTVQHAGVVLGIFGIAGHVHRRLERDQVGYCGRAALTQNFSAVTAACLLIRRSTYLSVGGLDEAHLAVDYNDVDFCLRLREAGWRQVWTPNAELFHHESATRGAKRKPEQLARFAAETAWMKQRWGRLLSRDPAYNPNLELGSVQFALAAAPRVNLTQAWFCDSEAPTAEPT
jgi:GT2 family glycosyltransferase